MTERPYASEPLAKLRSHFEAAQAAIVRAKHDIRLVNEELIERYGERFRALLHNQGREHGEHTVEEDGFRLKMVRDRAISWDQDKLKALMLELPWEAAEQIITMKLSVMERVYTRITDPNIKGRVDGARAVDYKPINVSFSE